jgi:CRP/FNR family transcriptional regulator, polysaccharide utilization system transcription regulator
VIVPTNAEPCVSCPSRLRSFFACLNSGQLQQLELHRGMHSYRKGERVYSEGQEPVGLHCIHTGTVKVYKLAPDGQRLIVQLVTAGDLLGYTALLSGEPYTSTAETVEDTELCLLGKDWLISLLNAEPGIGLRMIQLLSREVRQHEDRLVSLAQKRVRERLAEIILLLRRSHGVSDPMGDVIPLRLRREDLASIVGTTTESLVRELKALEQQEIIRLEKRSIRILNLPELIEAARL